MTTKTVQITVKAAAKWGVERKEQTVPVTLPQPPWERKLDVDECKGAVE